MSEVWRGHLSHFPNFYSADSELVPNILKAHWCIYSFYVSKWASFDTHKIGNRVIIKEVLLCNGKSNCQQVNGACEMKLTICHYMSYSNISVEGNHGITFKPKTSQRGLTCFRYSRRFGWYFFSFPLH